MGVGGWLVGWLGGGDGVGPPRCEARRCQYDANVANVANMMIRISAAPPCSTLWEGRYT